PAPRPGVRPGSVPRHPSHDRGTSALARAGGQARDRIEADPRHVRVPARRAVFHRGELEEARVDHAGPRRGRPARARSRRHRAAQRDARAVSGGAHAGEPYAQAILDRSASLQRHRERLLRRDPARGEDIAVEADALAVGRRIRSSVRRDAGDADEMDRSAARTGGRQFSREGDGVSRRDGGARQVQAAVSGLRVAGAADRVRRERVQLLRDVPDERPAAGRPLAVETAERRLAEVHRRPLTSRRPRRAGMQPWAVRHGPLVMLWFLPAQPSMRFREPSPIAFVVAAGLLLVLAYANHFQHGFHFDDSHAIVDNVYVRDLAYIPRYFTDATTFSVLPLNQSYRPALQTTFAIDYRIGGGYKPIVFQVDTFLWYLLLLAAMASLYLAI